MKRTDATDRAPLERDKERDSPHVRDLAEAFSVQARYSNKVWLALIAAASVVIYPELEPSNAARVKLPFSLGLVEVGTYKVIGFVILTILTLAYCQAYAGAHIATRFAHERLERIKPESEYLEAKSLYNLLIVGTFLRVSYLIQFKSRFSAVYYCILKLVASAVTFGIPIAALITAFMQLAASASVPRVIFWISFFGFCVASVAMAHALWLELRHVFRLAPLYWKGDLPDLDTPSKQA